MTEKVRPAGWAVSTFGRETAAALAEKIPAAIQVAITRQMNGHDAVGLASRHAFGGGWPARYEELVTHLGDIPGIQVVRPVGKSYQVVVVNNVVVLPVEYAKDLATAFDSPQALKKINKTALELARQFGPRSDYLQPALDGLEPDTDEPLADLLHGLEPDGIVIVYYAAHERLGLLRIGWGQISVSQNDAVRWVTSQMLQVPSAAPIPGLRVIADTTTSSSTPRFDEAALNNPVIEPRTAAQQATQMPVAERSEDQPRRDAQD